MERSLIVVAIWLAVAIVAVFAREYAFLAISLAFFSTMTVIEEM